MTTVRAAPFGLGGVLTGSPMDGFATNEAARVLEALEHPPLRPAMVAAVTRLRTAGLPLGLVANNVRPMGRTPTRAALPGEPT